MKIKKCDICDKEITHAYRVKITPGKIWIFVCGKCCLQSKKGDYYIYGGTWKGKKLKISFSKKSLIKSQKFLKY